MNFCYCKKVDIFSIKNSFSYARIFFNIRKSSKFIFDIKKSFSNIQKINDINLSILNLQYNK